MRIHAFEIAPICGFVLTLIALAFLLRIRARLPLDLPNHRSLHSRPIPRIGGLGLIPAVLISWLLIADYPLTLAGCVFALWLISYADDRASLPAILRFSTQLCAGVLFAAMSLNNPNWGYVIVVALIITWMANLFNFMDGSNGLAGGMAVIGFGTYAFIAGVRGDEVMGVLAVSVVGAALAFLIFNFHPARLFLGDSGSVPLGFVAASLGVMGWDLGLWDWWLPLFAFLPFILDASVTLVRRMCTGQRFWEAHRDHSYQRLIQLGWSHRRVALNAYGIMLLSSVTGILITQKYVLAGSVALSGLIAVLIGAGLWIESRWRRVRDEPK